MRGRPQRSVHRIQGLIDLVLANSTRRSNTECKPDRHFEKLNDEFCSGHFASIVVVPLAGQLRTQACDCAVAFHCITRRRASTDGGTSADVIKVVRKLLTKSAPHVGQSLLGCGFIASVIGCTRTRHGLPDSIDRLR
jgi:hypothetical protein